MQGHIKVLKNALPQPQQPETVWQSHIRKIKTCGPHSDWENTPDLLLHARSLKPEGENIRHFSLLLFTLRLLLHR